MDISFFIFILPKYKKSADYSHNHLMILLHLSLVGSVLTLSCSITFIAPILFPILIRPLIFAVDSTSFSTTTIEFPSRYSETIDSFDNYTDSDLSSAEMAYYMDVYERIMAKISLAG